MNSTASSRFWRHYDRLPAEVQRLAVKTYHLWLKDPTHPSLGFKKLKGSETKFSVRVGAHYRALGHRVADGVEWVWIGTHEEYNHLVGR